ncbi:hypothetical protein PH7735_00991 [Shimia thalassica]|uniref:Uncharacterized protein n=1 Tax=Shimia thalassica TaxID=1715693 RepID=A0A0N7M8L9_9RHOB|nr:hypothetical protein PH7735_00991 [Shimia thalassica]
MGELPYPLPQPHFLRDVSMQKHQHILEYQGCFARCLREKCWKRRRQSVFLKFASHCFRAHYEERGPFYERQHDVIGAKRGPPAPS